MKHWTVAEECSLGGQQSRTGKSSSVLDGHDLENTIQRASDSTYHCTVSTGKNALWPSWKHTDSCIDARSLFTVEWSENITGICAHHSLWWGPALMISRPSGHGSLFSSCCFVLSCVNTGLATGRPRPNVKKVRKASRKYYPKRPRLGSGYSEYLRHFPAVRSLLQRHAVVTVPC
jgi:hypothetical protein